MIDWLFSSEGTNTQQNINRVKGDFNFIIETTPTVPETNSNINIICYKNQNQKDILRVRIKWFRIKNGQFKAIEGATGNTYQCEPSDLGAKIKAEIWSLDEPVSGKAQVVFGPIKFDASLKQNIANILTKGKTRIGGKFYKDGK